MTQIVPDAWGMYAESSGFLVAVCRMVLYMCCRMVFLCGQEGTCFAELAYSEERRFCDGFSGG